MVFHLSWGKFLAGLSSEQLVGLRYFSAMRRHQNRSKYAPKKDEGQPGWRRRRARAGQF